MKKPMNWWWILPLLLLILLVFLAYYFFQLAQSGEKAFFENLAKGTLQLAVVVVIGALVKQAMDLRSKIQDLRAKEDENRKEFLKRIRDSHVAIRNAQVLILAQPDFNTWNQAMRSLLELKPPLEELLLEIRASQLWREKQEEIEEGIELINEYLAAAEREYIDHRSVLEQETEDKGTLTSAAEHLEMIWTLSFLRQEGHHHIQYNKGLQLSKRQMRVQVYGAGPDLNPLLTVDKQALNPS